MDLQFNDPKRTESYGRPALPDYLTKDIISEDDYSDESFDINLNIEEGYDKEDLERTHFIHRFQYEGN